MKHIKLFEEFLIEKKPKGAPDFYQSDAPEAEGRFKDLSPKDLAAWLIKTRKKDLKRISGSLTQQVVFNRNEDPKYADKMERTRKEVYKQLGRQDLLDQMDESIISEGIIKVDLNRIMTKIMGAIEFKTDPKLRKEILSAIKDDVKEIISNNKKYEIFEADMNMLSIDEKYKYVPEFDNKGYKEAQELISSLRSKVYKKMSDVELEEFTRAMVDHFNIDIPSHLHK